MHNGRRLPLGAGAAKQPFADMRSLSIVCFRRTLGTAAPGRDCVITARRSQGSWREAQYRHRRAFTAVEIVQEPSDELMNCLGGLEGAEGLELLAKAGYCALRPHCCNQATDTQ